MPKGKSLRIYLADGSASGIRHAEIVNWTGQALACPRARFAELKDWPELKKQGVYFLFGRNEQTENSSVYIGEAEVVFERLSSHLANKEFWSEVIAFTSKDENLTKAHVKYLESRLLEITKTAGRYEVQNSTAAPRPALPRADKDSMEEFIDSIRILLGTFGHKVLEPVLQISSSLPIVIDTKQISTAEPTVFHLNVSGLVAKGIRTDEGFVVLKDSQAALEVKPSLSNGSIILRKRLCEFGVLISNEKDYFFTKNQLFNSPSQAAGIIVGYSINGRDNWRTLDGQTLAEIENESISNLI